MAEQERSLSKHGKEPPAVGVFLLSYSKEYADALLHALPDADESEQGTILNEFLTLYEYHSRDARYQDEDAIRSLKKRLLGPDSAPLVDSLLEAIPSEKALRSRIEVQLLEQFHSGYEKSRRPRDVMEAIVKSHAPEYDYDQIQIRTALLKRFVLGAGFGCNTIPIEPLEMYLCSVLDDAWRQKYQQASLSQRPQLLADAIDNNIFDALSEYQLTNLQTLQVFINMLEHFAAETRAAPKNAEFLARSDEFCSKLLALCDCSGLSPLAKLQQLLALTETYSDLAHQILGDCHPSRRKGNEKVTQPRYFTVDGLPFTDLTLGPDTMALLANLGVQNPPSVLSGLRAVETRYRHDLNANAHLAALVKALDTEKNTQFKRIRYAIRDRSYSELARGLLLRDPELGKATRKHMRKFVQLGKRPSIVCLQEILQQCRNTPDDPRLAALMVSLESDLRVLADKHRVHRQRLSQTDKTEDICALYRTARKDERNRLSGKMGELLELCDDLAAGRFKANKVQNRKNCYHAAAMLGLNQEETESLLTSYYNDDLLRFFEGETPGPNRKSSFEAEPDGAGVNYKNFAECILCYHILKDSDLTPGQRLDSAYRTIQLCKRHFAERFEAELADEILSWEEFEQRPLSPEEKTNLRFEAENELDQSSLYTFKLRQVFMDEVLPIPTKATPSLEAYIIKKYPIPKPDTDEFLASADLRTLGETILELESAMVSLTQGANFKTAYHAVDLLLSTWSEINPLSKKYQSDPGLQHLWKDENFKRTLRKLHERLSKQRDFYLHDEIAAMASILLALKTEAQAFHAGRSKTRGMTKYRLKNELTEFSKTSGITTDRYTAHSEAVPLHTDKFLSRMLHALRDLGDIEQTGTEYFLSREAELPSDPDKDDLIAYLYHKLPSNSGDLTRTMLMAVYTAYFINVELDALQKSTPGHVFLRTVRDRFIQGLNSKLDVCRFAEFQPDFLIDSYVLLALELHVLQHLER